MDFKEKNRKFNIILSTVIMLLSLIVFTGCDNGKKSTDEYSFIKDVDYTSAIIEKNNNIYLYDKNYSYLEPIGELAKQKEFSSFNEDSQKVVFKYIDDKSKINIYDVKTMENTVLEIEDEGEISYLKWFGNLIVVGVYENPTTNKYLVYDSETLKLINSCKGILIDVLDEGKTLVHGANTQGVTSIYLNDENIYTLEKTGEVLLNGKVSLDRKEISFLTFVFDRKTFEQKEYLYTAKMEKNKLKDLKVIDKPYEIYGELAYDGDKVVILNQDVYAEVIDEEFVVKDLSEVNKSIGENSSKLKGILKDTFKSEITDIDKSWTDLGIKNITWFSR